MNIKNTFRSMAARANRRSVAYDVKYLIEQWEDYGDRTLALEAIDILQRNINTVSL